MFLGDRRGLAVAGRPRVPRPRRDRSRWHEPADRGVGRRRDDEADRSAADDAQLRGLHPLTSDRRSSVGPGAGKGTQAEVLADRLGIAHVATGDLFRAAVRDESPIGLEARRYMERGQLVPDDITIRMLLDRLAQPRRQGRRAPRWLPAQPHPGRDARRGPRRARRVGGAGPQHRGRGPTSSSVVCPAAGSAATRATSTTSTRTRREVPGRCDIDGSPLIQREDDKPETIRARLTTQLASLRDVVDHYRSAGVLRTVDGVARSMRSRTPCSQPSATAHPAAGTPTDVVTRKSRAEIARMRQAGRIVAEVLALVEQELKPGVTTGHLDRLAEAPHPQGRRDPVVQGLSRDQPAPAVPGQPVHLHR